jgi:hypothetical protein
MRKLTNLLFVIIITTINMSCRSSNTKSQGAAGMIIDGITLDTQKEITRYPSGAVLSGFSAKKQLFTTFEIPQHATLFFYESGKLSQVWADTDITIDSLRLSGSTEIHLYENGNIKTGFLAKNAIIQGVEFKAESEVNFYSSGQIQEGIAAVNQPFHEQAIISDDRVQFHQNGELSAIYNDWGVGFFDESGKPAGHKEYLRKRE